MPIQCTGTAAILYMSIHVHMHTYAQSGSHKVLLVFTLCITTCVPYACYVQFISLALVHVLTLFCKKLYITLDIKVGVVWNYRGSP